VEAHYELLHSYQEKILCYMYMYLYLFLNTYISEDLAMVDCQTIIHH